MKKLLSLLGVLILSASFANAGEFCDRDCPPPPPPEMHKNMPPKHNLEKELNLTDEQISKARQLRMESHKQIKPLVEELKSKQEQKRAIMNSQINQKEQIEMIAQLNKDIAVLKNKIHAIKVKNDKDFEALLTDKQKKKFEKIKYEARKDFEKNHKKCPCPPPPEK